MTDDFARLETVGFDKIAADPAGTQQAFARIGYQLHEAVADLIDNSIDAEASRVLIRLMRDNQRVHRIAIVDDGQGMTAPTLMRGMQFGARMTHKPTDRGKYGIGLKAASFSQARSVTVATKQAGISTGRRWTEKDIKRGWYCARLAESSAAGLLNHHWGDVDLEHRGTVVLWEDLDRLPTLMAGVDVTVQKVISGLTNEIGLVFHRFVERGDIRISLDSENTETGVTGPPIEVAPLDPFGYPRSGRARYPRRIPVRLRRIGHVELEAHIWPTRMRTAEYRLGSGKVASRQGFYFYRNDRIIQAGGWNGIREDDGEPHLSLARVKVDLDPRLDHAFQLKVQKSGVEVPLAFRDALTKGPASKPMSAFFRDADKTYRNDKNLAPAEPQVVLDQGVPERVRALSRRMAGRRDVRKLRIDWRDLPEELIFTIDRDSPALTMNARYRRVMQGSSRASANDLPIVKVLLFLLLQDEFDRQRRSRAAESAVSRINQLLRAAVER